MLFRQFYVEGLAAMSYMVGNRSPGAVAVVDPIRDIDMYLEMAKQEGVKITHIFETHIHVDFVSGSRELAEKTGAKIYLSSHGGSEWQYEFDCANGKRAGAMTLIHIAIENGWTLQETFEKARSFGFDYESEPQKDSLKIA